MAGREWSEERLYYSRKPWHGHSQVGTMISTIKLLQKAKPVMAIIENVGGFNQPGRNEQQSPLQFFLQELESDYEACVCHVDLAWWMQMTRRRIGRDIM